MHTPEPPLSPTSAFYSQLLHVLSLTHACTLSPFSVVYMEGVGPSTGAWSIGSISGPESLKNNLPLPPSAAINGFSSGGEAS